MSDVNTFAEEYESDSSGSRTQILKPYDLEPLAPRNSSDSSDEEVSGGSETEDIRIGNTDCCVCGNCQPMQTYTESICCQENNEIAEEFFKGLFLLAQ